jgi:hypothetical protein
MSSKRDKRLATLEQKAPIKRQFFGWIGNPWTPEQMEEAIRQEPERMIFWRSLVEESRRVIEEAEGGRSAGVH